MVQHRNLIHHSYHIHYYDTNDKEYKDSKPFKSRIEAIRHAKVLSDLGAKNLELHTIEKLGPQPEIFDKPNRRAR